VKTLPKYLKKAEKESTKKGWEWKYNSGSGHITIFDGNGDYVIWVSLTAYDGSVTKQNLSKLRRAKCPGLV
jgi:hypothetical protein